MKPNPALQAAVSFMSGFLSTLVLVLFFSLTSHSGFAQNPRIDSLETLFASADESGQKLELLEQMTNIAFGINLNQALIYTGRGVALADKSGDGIWQPKFYEMHGRMHANLSNLDSASLYFDKAMAGYTAIGNEKGQATTAFKKAWVSKRKGHIENAMKYDLQGLRLMEEIGDKEGIASGYGRVSEDLMIQGRPEEALEYAKNSIAICEANHLDGELFYSLRSAGDACIADHKPDKALKYYDKARELGISLGEHPASLASITNSRGNAYKRLGRYKEALVDYRECLAIAKKSNFADGVAAATANLGETNLLMGNFAEALPYQLETVRLAEASGNMSNLVENYQHTSTIYSKLGRFEEALGYERKSRALHDSLLSEKSDIAVSELRTQYETEKKEATIKAQMLQLKQRNKVQWLTVGVAFLLAGFLFFLYKSYRSRTRKNALLKAKNTENELLLKEIHHRVKNNLEVVSSLLELQSAQIENQGVRDAMRESQNRVHSIGIVHQKLYTGKNLGAIEMKDYFLNLSESILDTFGAEDRVEIVCAMNRLNVDIDTAVPLGLIVNELLTNTLKYAFPGNCEGRVRIELKMQAEGQLYLEVSDNGTGKISETKGTGFGSQLIALLTSQLRGSMQEDNTNGTRVFFNFNLEKAHA